MNSRPSKMSKRRLSDLAEIVQGPSLRNILQGLMRSMRELPLTTYDLAEFLRLVWYDEICEENVADENLPFLIAQLQRFLSMSTDELLEILCTLRAQEWKPVPASSLGPVLEASEPHKEPRPSPAFLVPSFHDPPGRKR